MLLDTNEKIGTLVHDLAVSLAFFQTEWRYELRHIHSCGYLPRTTGAGHDYPCSPRCEAVRAVLARSAVALGCEINDFYPKPKIRKEKINATSTKGKHGVAAAHTDTVSVDGLEDSPRAGGDSLGTPH